MGRSQRAFSADTYLEPDFVFYPKAVGIKGLDAAAVLLAVEVSDFSLDYDLGRKAALYAGFGIAELWVIDAVMLTTRIHRDPKLAGYASILDLPPGSQLAPDLGASLSVTLIELELH